jgi:hypothetical protein
MNLKLAVLADHVNETKEGKLNLLGVFDVLFAKKLPAKHPKLFLVAVFEASVSEGSEHKAKVGVYDSDGQEVLPLTPELPLKFQPTGRGKPFQARLVVELEGLRFPHFGDYEFHLLIDGRIEGQVGLEVRQIKGGKGRVSG